MSIEDQLSQRSGGACELCADSSTSKAVNVGPGGSKDVSDHVLMCSTCASNWTNAGAIDANHWRSLNDAIWSAHSAVKVASWRVLNQLGSAPWAQDLLEMMYLEPEEETWAKSSMVDQNNQVIHKDINGQILETGDNVVLIKDLKVKGANFTAKRGTAVRRIRVDLDNADFIEGKINGQNIVILTEYVKKG